MHGSSLTRIRSDACMVGQRLGVLAAGGMSPMPAWVWRGVRVIFCLDGSCAAKALARPGAGVSSPNCSCMTVPQAVGQSADCVSFEDAEDGDCCITVSGLCGALLPHGNSLLQVYVTSVPDTAAACTCCIRIRLVNYVRLHLHARSAAAATGDRSSLPCLHAKPDVNAFQCGQRLTAV